MAATEPSTSPTDADGAGSHISRGHLGNLHLPNVRRGG